MVLGFQAVAELIQQMQQTEAALPLKHPACRSRFFLHSQPTSKVCLFFHGFTAAPYQFEPLGEALFRAGYNVLVPLQPGHGRAGNWNRRNPPPLPLEIQAYQKFALEWLEIAQAAGENLVIGGLSTGGTLAAWLALEYAAVIDRTLLFTPYLASKSPLEDWFIKLMPIYFEWFNKNAPGNFGYQGFPVPALRIFLELGQQILRQAQSQPSAPLLMVCSEADQAVSRTRQQDYFKAVIQGQPHGWYYCFDDSLKIEHRMMTRLEDNDYEELVIVLAQAFIDSNLTWNQFQQLATLMAQGKFDENILAQEFHLNTPACSQLSKMMTNVYGCNNLECINPFLK